MRNRDKRRRAQWAVCKRSRKDENEKGEKVWRGFKDEGEMRVGRELFLLRLLHNSPN
jgi:hypothetical protein